jgi:hypothetical protein
MDALTHLGIKAPPNLGFGQGFPSHPLPITSQYSPATIHRRVPWKRWCHLLLLSVAFLPQIGPAQEPAATSVSSASPTTPMQKFVIIFRQDPQPLSATDKQRRAEETAAWARRQNAAGHKLDPHILAPESAHSRPEGSTVNQTDSWTITALLFLQAHDLSEAAQIAESHPALHYGASVEVRPWSPPVPVPTTAQVTATP